MSSMLGTIVPKSDQLNADDLIGGVSKTIKITSVSILAGDQPVSLNFEGDNGKPFKPCKSMRRVLVNVWGSDGNAYVGRSMTLYRDDKVKFGGLEVGGIRISHMSDITEPVTMALTATRAARKPYTVKPLGTVQQKQPVDPAVYDDAIAKVKAALTIEQLDAAVAESRLIKGWPKDKTTAMKATIEEQRTLINQTTETERQPGEE